MTVLNLFGFGIICILAMFFTTVAVMTCLAEYEVWKKIVFGKVVVVLALINWWLVYYFWPLEIIIKVKS